MNSPRTVRRRIAGLVVEAHPVVFPASAAVVMVAVAVAACWPRRVMLLFDWLQAGIAHHFAWWYLLAMSGFLVFALYLCFSRYGHIRLGSDDQRPEFSTPTWLAMLFSAGMGIGMLFYGVAEPTWHFLAPPEMQGQSLAAARNAMGITLFHWCLHPWALYALVGASLAYFSFRRGLPLSFRSVFYPLLGKRIEGWLGDLIDILAVVATLFGLATSLGLGAKQVNAGLAHLFGLGQSVGIQVALIAGITAIAVVSLASGLHAGVRRLSEINMVLAGSLLVYVIVMGPTTYLLSGLVENIGAYGHRLSYSSFWTGAYATPEKTNWLSSWTIFYWGWWIAWSPFVGMFIARISKGRTLREFILGVLLVPSALGAIWMSGLGGAALHQVTASLRLPAAEAEAEVARLQREYPVQVLDELMGMPQDEAGEWLIAAHALSAATPIGILVRPDLDAADPNQVNFNTDGSPSVGLVTKSGNAVRYHRGVLVHADSVTPYRPSQEERFNGRYMAQTESLDLAGYLSRPVLSADHRQVADTTSTALFVMLSAYPAAAVAAVVATLSIVLFFVTSSDSASLVADIIASGGQENPSVGTRVFWGVLEGFLAASLLVAGGLKGLQTGAITIGLPFSVLIVLMCISLHRGLRQEGKIPTGRLELDRLSTDPPRTGAPAAGKPAAEQRLAENAASENPGEKLQKK